MVGGYIIIDLAKPANEIISKLSANNHNKAIMLKNVKLGTDIYTTFGTYTRTGSTWEIVVTFLSGGKTSVSEYTVTSAGVTNIQKNLVRM